MKLSRRSVNLAKDHECRVRAQNDRMRRGQRGAPGADVAIGATCTVADGGQVAEALCDCEVCSGSVAQ